MSSRRLIIGAVAASAAVLAVTAAAPAYALTTVKVTAGSAPSGTSVAVKGAAGTINLKDLTTNATGTCTASNLTGTTKAGANSPSSVATINGGTGAITFTSCSTLGLPLTISGVGSNVWTLSATANTASGSTAIKISNINVKVDSSSCSFNVTGSAVGTFKNGNPSTIAIPATTAANSQLAVSNFALKSGQTRCLGGSVTNTSPGNKISLAGTYNVTATNSAYNPVTAIAS